MTNQDAQADQQSEDDTDDDGDEAATVASKRKRKEVVDGVSHPKRKKQIDSNDSNNSDLSEDENKTEITNSVRDPLLLVADFNAKALMLHSICGKQYDHVLLSFHPHCIACHDDVIVVGGASFDNEGAVQQPQLQTLNLDGDLLYKLSTKSAPWSLAFANDGCLACGESNGNVAVYVMKDSQIELIRSWNVTDDVVYTITWVNDSLLWCGGWNGCLSTWDVHTGTLVSTMQAPNGTEVTCLSASSSNTLLSCHDNGNIRKWSLMDLTHVEFKAHPWGIRGIVVFTTCDSSTIITSSLDRFVAAFDMATFQEKWRYKCDDCATSLTVLDNEVYVGVHNSFIVVLSIATGQFVRRFQSINTGSVSLIISDQHRGALATFKLTL